MAQLVEFPLESGGAITVEVNELEREEIERIGIREGIATATETFEKSLAKLKPAAKATMETLRGLGPDELTVEFSFKLSTAAGVIITSAGAEANFKVTLKWKPQPENKQ